jgi:hypothetical protein
MSARKCMHCTTAETSTHRLKNCGRCKMVAYCNTACQHADWPAHKLVCNKHDGLRLGYAGNTDGSVVFQDPSGTTSDEVFKHYIPLRVPPSPELPHGMTTLLKIEPAVAEELAKLTAGERAFIEQAAAEAMRNVVHEDTIRKMIVDAIEMAKKARVVVQREEEAEAEAVAEVDGSSTDDDDDDSDSDDDDDEDDDDDDDDEIEDSLWEKARKVLAIKY